MRLPGFTAEVALHKTGKLFNAVAIPAAAESQKAVPQLFCHGNYCCDEYGNCIYKGRVLQ
jgi:hypothetical protein